VEDHGAAAGGGVVSLDQLITFFDARILGTWSMEEWAEVVAKIRANRGRFGIGQW
jgi:hypothetical protein